MPEAMSTEHLKHYVCERHQIVWACGDGPEEMPCPYCERERAERAEAERNKLVDAWWGLGGAIRGMKGRGGAEDLILRFKGAKCDSPAVASCIRCNVVFLAKKAKDMLAALEEVDYDAMHRPGRHPRRVRLKRTEDGQE